MGWAEWGPCVMTQSLIPDVFLTLDMTFILWYSLHFMNLNYKCYNANGEQVIEEGKKVKFVQSKIFQWSEMQTSLFFQLCLSQHLSSVLHGECHTFYCVSIHIIVFSINFSWLMIIQTVWNIKLTQCDPPQTSLIIHSSTTARLVTIILCFTYWKPGTGLPIFAFYWCDEVFIL